MSSMEHYICELASQVSSDRLKRNVRSIEGLRHGWENYDILNQKANDIEETFRSLHLTIENQEFMFHGRTYRNIVATKEGRERGNPWILLGAHYDSAWGSPGADDNGSGVAALIETAHILCSHPLECTVQFVAFTLEEPQPQTIHFLIGSDYFAKDAKRQKRQFKAVLILESVGYSDNTDGSQFVPHSIGIRILKKGNFLGIIANNRSKALMEAFHNTAHTYVPELITVPYVVPFSGRLIPETRFSDHASFWNQRYPALMLTDTAMFRNPYYHTHRDEYATLDFTFMTHVTKAVVSTMAVLANQ
jgi:aminopeptidase YwaD